FFFQAEDGIRDFHVTEVQTCALPISRLFAKGIDKAAQKMGEEAVETVIAAVKGERAAVVSESADLLYHWLVVLALSGVSLDDVMAELEARTNRSGVAEKAARNSG